MVSKAIKVFVPPAPATEEGEDPVINKDEAPEPTKPVVEKVK